MVSLKSPSDVGNTCIVVSRLHDRHAKLVAYRVGLGPELASSLLNLKTFIKVAYIGVCPIFTLYVLVRLFPPFFTLVSIVLSLTSTAF
jgi:hypothetical protein